MIDIFDSIALGLRISHYRRKLKYSQKMFAEKLNVSQSTIWKLESGKIQSLNMSKLETIANILNVTVDTLLVDSLDKFNDSNKKPAALFTLKIMDLLPNLTDNQTTILNEFLEFKYN